MTRRVKRLSVRRRREYIKSGAGMWCPYCRSVGIESLGLDPVGVSGCWHMEWVCGVCGAEWTDVLSPTDVIGRSDAALEAKA